jgi:hypothetical protein
MANDRLHPQVTQLSGFRYLFTAKHHGGGGSGDACWSPDVTDVEEFFVFDQADALRVVDTNGWLYGVLPDGEGGLRDIGTWQQQVAEFPAGTNADPWHGYPVWAVGDAGPQNRKGQHMRPERMVFDLMEAVGLIDARIRKRLWKGAHA